MIVEVNDVYEPTKIKHDCIQRFCSGCLGRLNADKLSCKTLSEQGYYCDKILVADCMLTALENEADERAEFEHFNANVSRFAREYKNQNEE